MINRDFPLAPTSQPQAIDNTYVKKPMNIKSLGKIDAEKKVKIASKLYKDNPSKVFSDAVDTAKNKLSRIKN
jgi:hypothetical protein